MTIYESCDCCGDHPKWLIPDDSFDGSTCECINELCLNTWPKPHCLKCCKCNQMDSDPEELEERIC